VEFRTKSAETTNVKNVVEKIKGIREGLMQTLKTLREKIRTLETERAGLMVEIEKLKKVAESRADALENEVNQLREEIKKWDDLMESKDDVALYNQLGHGIILKDDGDIQFIYRDDNETMHRLKLSIDDGKNYILEEESGNKIEMGGSGMKITDKNGNVIDMTATGVTIDGNLEVLK
jgi:regulator of replication initiation timing